MATLLRGVLIICVGCLCWGFSSKPQTQQDVLQRKLEVSRQAYERDQKELMHLAKKYNWPLVIDSKKGYSSYLHSTINGQPVYISLKGGASKPQRTTVEVVFQVKARDVLVGDAFLSSFSSTDRPYLKKMSQKFKLQDGSTHILDESFVRWYSIIVPKTMSEGLVLHLSQHSDIDYVFTSP